MYVKQYGDKGSTKILQSFISIVIPKGTLMQIQKSPYIFVLV